MKAALVSLVFMLVSLCSSAQSTKVGVADMDYIVSQLPETKTLETELRKFEQELTAKIRASGQELEQQYQQYEQSAATMTEEERTKKEEELQALQQQLQQEQQEARLKLQQRYEELISPIQEKAKGAIAKVAQANNYTYVLAKQVAGNLFTLYPNNGESDISDMVLKELGVAAAPTGSK